MTPHTYINFDKKYKKEDQKFRKYKIIAAVAGFLILLGGFFYAVVYSPLFQVIKINVDNPLVDGDFANNLKDFFVNQSKFTKFLGPDNILIWNGNKLEKFEKDPEIAEISLKKDYAERTIEINVKLRERFGVWCQNSQQVNTSSTEQQVAESCWWFDKDGVLFAAAPELEGNAINKVDDFSGRDLMLGGSALDERFISNLTGIFGVLEKSGLGIRALKLENLALQEIVFDQPQTSLPKIYFSLRENPEFTLAAINDLKKIGLEKIAYIDLRVGNRVYYKLR
ncbi:MAG: hypothetical protein WC461_01585 [Candidatus Paceibacterota bacterium]